jgi:integrase
MATTQRRRLRGDGTIYEDPPGSGRWKGQVDLGWRDGKRHRPVARDATAREVSEQLAELRRRAGMGQLAPGRAPSVEQAVEAWLAGKEHELKAKTLASYRWVAQTYVIPALGAGKRADRVTPADIRAMTKALMDRGLSKRSAQYAHRVAGMALGDAVRLGQLSHNAAALTKAPRPRKVAQGALGAPEARKLLAAAQKAPEGRRADRGPLWILALTTGLRQGEILALRWADVDLTARRILVVEGKSDSARRYVPLTEVAALALGEAGAPEALVFPSRAGTPIGARNLVRDWHEFTLSTLGRTVKFHALRHTAATLMLEAGVPLKVISELLGHSSIAVTSDLYCEVVDALKSDAAARMDGIFAPPES